MIKINAIVNTNVETAWDAYNNPTHIQNWNFASPDWHCPASENDLKIGGRFKHTMAAKDGSFSFDFSGMYNDIIENQRIDYTLDDGRKVKVEFIADLSNKQTEVIVEFEPEKMNPNEMQQQGWQAILNNYKHYAEKLN